MQDTERDGLLTDVKMQIAADFTGTERTVALFFEVTDVQHLLVGVEKIVIGLRPSDLTTASA